jgi:hypothetical protein
MSQDLLTSGRQTGARRRIWPGRFEIIFHALKTFRLIGHLLLDRRIPLWRKAAFLLTCAALALVLFFPDLFGELITSTLLPLVGTVIGVPLDAGFDWLTFALVVVSLLRLFPPEVVEEEYQRIFHRR